MESGDDDVNLLPTVPDPTMLSVAMGVVRGLLQIASGLGFGFALTVTGDQVTMIATAVVMVITLCWSAQQKFSAIRKRRHVAALATELAKKRVAAAELAQGHAETRSTAAEAAQGRAEERAGDAAAAQERAENRNNQP